MHIGGETKEPHKTPEAAPVVLPVLVQPRVGARLLKRSSDFPLDNIPIMASDLLLLREGQVLVIVSPNSGYEGKLNETASLVLSFCDGVHAVQEIVRQFTVTYGISEQQALLDVRSTLRWLAKIEAIISTT